MMRAILCGKVILFVMVAFVGLGGAWGQTPVADLPKFEYKINTPDKTFIVPAGVYSLTLEAWGGGGGGGRSTSRGTVCGGGGGGAYARRVVLVSPGQQLTITVGDGGSGGDNNKNGGDSYVSHSVNGVVVRASGGSGVNNNDRIGGAGGQISACIGDVKWAGGKGGNGSTGDDSRTAAGGGGGGAGSSGNGNNGGNGITASSGLGGGTGGAGGAYKSEYGGAGGNGASKDELWGNGGTGGDATSDYGGGGGGAKRGSAGASNRNGGDGGDGFVRISLSAYPTISLVSGNTVCKGYPALKGTSPYEVRPSNGWEWIISGQGSGTYTSTNTFAAETSGTYKVRAHYNNITWDEKTYSGSNWLYEDSQNEVSITVNPTPVIANKTIYTCSGDPFSLVMDPQDVIPTGTTYTWSTPTLTGVTTKPDVPTAGTNKDVFGGTLINTTTTTQTVTYTVTPKAGDCAGAPFNVVVSVYYKPDIPYQETKICSGDEVSHTPQIGIPEGTTYSWELKDVSPGNSISSPPQSGSGNNINLNALANKTSANADLTYEVTFTTPEGCVGTFTFKVTVHPIPEIVDPGVICSGDSKQLQLKYPNNDTYDDANGGTSYSSSDASIAYVDANGMLYTDVQMIEGQPAIVEGHPIQRPAYDSDEGKGGTVTITYITAAGCEVTKDITVKPRTKTPGTRWDFDGTCPINEDGDHEAGDSTKIATPWNVHLPDGSQRIYFVNHIVWDSLVVVNHVENPNPVENVKFLKQIKWYADNDGEPGDFIRYGLADLPGDGRMSSFFQNEKHEEETYWATVTDSNHCESYPVKVCVNIAEALPIDLNPLIGYVQPEGTAKLRLTDFLGLELDGSQVLEWYKTEADAEEMNEDLEYYKEIGKPDPLDPTVPIDTTYWLVKADTFGCRSKATPFRIRLVPMPKLSLVPDTLVCPGQPVAVKLTISDATPPYNFTITNMNTKDVDVKTGYEEDTYSFSVNPQVSVNRRVTQFSDSITSLVTHDEYKLRTPTTGYFAQNTLRVVVSEITGISPSSGPIGGGTYTGDLDTPTDPNGLVTITGSGFAPFGVPAVERITFGSSDATRIEVVDNNTIKCTPPSQQLSGNVTVTVIAACGTITQTDGYRYEPMNIIAITPDYGPVTGGTRVVIQGTGLLAADVESNSVTVTIAGVPATIERDNNDNTKIVCITGESTSSMIGSIVIYNGAETREFARSFTYYPVKFIDDGKWSDYHHWETQTNDHILPFPGADVQIKANCLQDRDVDMDSITVAPGKAYTLESGINLNANVFTLKENATFLNNNVSSGNMRAVQQNVEHLLSKGRNWYVSSPVRGGSEGPRIKATFGKDAEGNDLSIWGNERRVQSYSEVQRKWLEENGADSVFYDGLGYTVYSETVDIGAKFSGKYADGDITAGVSVTRTGTTHEERGFNLLGNPYPSYWRWTAEAAASADLYSTIWYRTQVGGVYQFWSYNASGDVAVAPGWEDGTLTGSYSLGYIPPMQAFWVRMLDVENVTNRNFTFADSRRSHADHASNGMKAKEQTMPETRPLLRLTAGDKGSLDEIVVYADSKAQADFDTYDGDKLFVNRGVEIYTLPMGSTTRPLVINGLPDIANGTEIPLGFRANEAGTFCFHAKEILNIDTLDVFLVDKWRNVEIDLRNDDYCFASNSIPTVDRFNIVFRSLDTSNLPDAEKADADDGDNKLLAYTNSEGQIVVVLHLKKGQESADVSVFDISGRKLGEQKVFAGEDTVIDGDFSGGMYMLRAGKCSEKILVQRR